MKKIVFGLLGLILFAGGTMAQNYKPFKLGLGIGYTMPGDGGGGILLDIEPAYRINDAIAVGLRIESAAMVKNIESNGNTIEGKLSANLSYTINGQYYFIDAKVRPYAGLGLGIFTIASFSSDASSLSGGGGSEFGFYPRIGVDIRHFNINLDYNIISATGGTTVDGASTYKTKIKNSYLGIRVGAFIFGGRR